MITLKVKKQMIIFLLTDKPQGVLEKITARLFPCRYFIISSKKLSNAA